MNKSMEELISENRPAINTLVGKKDLVGVEIGTQEGYHAINMLRRLDIKKLYLVDPYISYPSSQKDNSSLMDIDKMIKAKEESIEILKEFGNVERIFKTSELASIVVTEPLDFVYIDGDHRREMVREDIVLWFPKIKAGGLIAGHDFKLGEQGVIKAVYESFGDWFKKDGWDWWRIR